MATVDRRRDAPPRRPIPTDLLRRESVLACCRLVVWIEACGGTDVLTFDVDDSGAAVQVRDRLTALFLAADMDDLVSFVVAHGRLIMACTDSGIAVAPGLCSRFGIAKPRPSVVY